MTAVALADKLCEPKAAISFGCPHSFLGDRSLSPLGTLSLADLRPAHWHLEIASAKSDYSDVIDLCSVSSGDEDGRAVGSPLVDSDATLSEASDTDSVAEGC